VTDADTIARVKLARRIRETLAKTLSTPQVRAEWLRQQANAIEAEAERAKRPLERFDVAADDPQGAF
jgi:hypothetical protein